MGAHEPENEDERETRNVRASLLGLLNLCAMGASTVLSWMHGQWTATHTSGTQLWSVAWDWLAPLYNVTFLVYACSSTLFVAVSYGCIDNGDPYTRAWRLALFGASSLRARAFSVGLNLVLILMIVVELAQQQTFLENEFPAPLLTAQLGVLVASVALIIATWNGHPPIYHHRRKSKGRGQRRRTELV